LYPIQLHPFVVDKMDSQEVTEILNVNSDHNNVPISSQIKEKTTSAAPLETIQSLRSNESQKRFLLLDGLLCKIMKGTLKICFLFILCMIDAQQKVSIKKAAIYYGVSNF